MNREWRRVPSDTLCGYCPHRTIAKDEPALFTKLPGVKRERVRCQNCAGEAPPDLPDRIVTAGIADMAKGFASFGNTAKWKTRGQLKVAAKEWTPYREPGEEG